MTSVSLCLRLVLCALLPLYVVSICPDPPYLLISTSHHVYHMMLGGTCSPTPWPCTVPCTSSTGIRDVDYDFANEEIFWGHQTAGCAGRSHCDRCSTTCTVPNMRDLAVDWINNEVYYSFPDVPTNLAVYDMAKCKITPLTPNPPSVRYYDLTVDPNSNKLYSVDGFSNKLFQYNLNTLVLEKAHAIGCPARHLSHVDGNKLFFTCPSDGVYSFHLTLFQDTLLENGNPAYGDVTSYNSVVYWAEGGCVFSKLGGTVTTVHCFPGKTIQGLTVVHPSLQQ